MTLFSILVLAAALLLMVHSVTVTRRAKVQVSEILEALSDIKCGNGNRRLLAKTNEIISPIAYEINDIVLSYESQLGILRQSEEAHRQLMTSLSHDVRTPLTTLIGYLDAAQRGIVTGKERDDYIEIACQKSHDLKEYIDELFDWFKLNSNEFALSTATVDMAELTRNVLADWIPLLENKGIEYMVSIPEQPFYVNLDSEGYTRIFNNLVQNILMHSRADKIEISLEDCENAVQIRISDNGIGIKTDELNHIFERLYKCDKGRSKKGSGLGLAIVRQLTEKMDGRIMAESELDKGTAFTLLFPLSNNCPASANFL